jgi:hypothetical protein
LAIFLCGKKNYRLPLRKRNISTIDNKLNLEVLLDKSEYDISIYQVYLQTGHSIIKLDGSLDIQAIIPRDRKAEDCKAIKTFSFFKSFKPMITRYCWRG